MYKNRSVLASARLLGAVAMITLVFSTFAADNIGLVRAQDLATSTPDSTAAGETAQTAVPSVSPAEQPGIQSMAVDGSSLYYYADGKRIPLTPSLDWVSVKFASPSASLQSAALSASGAPVNPQGQVRHISNPELNLLPLQKGVSVEALLQGVNSMRAMPADFAQVDPVFQTADAEMAITDEFIATFPAGQSQAKMDAINSSHGVKIVKPILGQRNTFVLKVTSDAHLDSLAMANLYQETGLAINAAPNFVRILQSPPASYPGQITSSTSAPAVNDPWYPDQWALHNTQQNGTWMIAGADIHAPGAWDQTTGSTSVIIAVIDDGVDLTHEDLGANLVTGHDSTGLGGAGGACGAPCGNEDNAHGTNVAGLAAAVTDNSIGVAGVCQSCKIMPVRVAYVDTSGAWITSDSWIADGITWAYTNGAYILDNGWAGGSASTVITDAISNAKTSGRGGDGSVVLAPAGDSFTDGLSYPASLGSVISVGASNMCDQQKTPTYSNCNGFETGWGSNYGPALDISAPGVWLDSTDRMGTTGYSPLLDNGILGNNYFAYMNGTAGATAIVSGVAGLVLSVNPSLTANQVQTVLQNNADDVNSDYFSGWDQYMGYGRVDANRAVTAAAAISGPITLRVSKTGTGAGTVTSSPLGIDCGATCAFGFDLNTPVTLTAVASTRSVFTGWSGACTGTGLCNVTMSVSRSVTADFDLPVPAKVVLNSPANAAKTNDNTPLLSWYSVVPYGNTYEVQIAAGSGFASPLQDSTGAGLNYTASALVDDQYYWRVRAISAILLPGVWSNSRIFTVDTVPPGTPVLTSPLDNAIVHETPLFKWKSVATANAYQFEYDNNINCPSPSYTSPVLTSPSFTPPAMALGTWYWCASARDAAGNWGPWSTSFIINVHAPIPAKPVLISPAKGAITTTTPTLTWGSVAYANTYDLEIDTSSTFTSPILTTLIVGTSQGVGPLASGKWYWRVLAVNSDGDQGMWSSSRNFIVP